MNDEKLKEYQAEFDNALTQLKMRLTEAYEIMGILASFNYLIKKELAKKPERVKPKEEVK